MAETWKPRKENTPTSEENRIRRRLGSFGVKREDIREQVYNTSPTTLLLLQIAELYLDGKPTKVVVERTGVSRNTVDRLRQTRFSSRLQRMIEMKRREVEKLYPKINPGKNQKS